MLMTHSPGTGAKNRLGKTDPKFRTICHANYVPTFIVFCIALCYVCFWWANVEWKTNIKNSSFPEPTFGASFQTVCHRHKTSLAEFQQMQFKPVNTSVAETGLCQFLLFQTWFFWRISILNQCKNMLFYAHLFIVILSSYWMLNFASENVIIWYKFCMLIYLAIKN